jgi:hypothetical protein
MENLVHKVLGIAGVVVGFLTSNGVIAHNPAGGFTIIGVGGLVLVVNRYVTALEKRIQVASGATGASAPGGLEGIALKMLHQVEQAEAKRAGVVDPTGMGGPA